MDDWKDFAKHLWALLVPAGWWMWNKQDSRLKEIEGTMQTRQAAQDRREHVDDALEARRQDIIALHAKVDAKYDRLDNKIDCLNRDVNQGMSEIKSLLLSRK